MVKVYAADGMLLARTPASSHKGHMLMKRFPTRGEWIAKSRKYRDRMEEELLPRHHRPEETEAVLHPNGPLEKLDKEIFKVRGAAFDG